jgi:hypothetical protein
MGKASGQAKARSSETARIAAEIGWKKRKKKKAKQ